MSSVRRWAPFDVSASQSPLAGWPGLEPASGGPLMDVYETAEAIILQVSLPGVNPEDLSVTVSGDTLTIQGEAKEDPAASERQYLLRERVYGRFLRTVQLPRGVDARETEARFERGVLTLTVPRVAEARPRQVQVKVA